MSDELFRPDLEAVLKHYSIDLPWSYSGTGWAKIGCPWPDHDDSNPSATANLEAGKVNCFGCGQHGDALDLIQAWEGKPLVEAAEWASQNFPPASGGGRAGSDARKPRRNVRDGGAGDRSGGRRTASARVRTSRTRWD